MERISDRHEDDLGGRLEPFAEARQVAVTVVAAPGTTFRLPEVSMGLVPGAGGTASIPARIGRHRTAYMALSGAAVTAQTALGWGLVDSVRPLPGTG